MNSAARHSFAAGFLGWTLDAFDFFVLVFLEATLARQFGVPKAAIIATIPVTLAARPLGAFLFGILADRYGRRVPLMANVVYFSIVEVLCGFASSYHAFLALRALFGIGMGGEWGVGAALALEAAPKGRRGVLSGLLQSGYSTGYLLAALAARFVLPHYGWRAMFWCGGAPALLALYVRAKVPESQAWQRQRPAGIGEIFATLRRFAAPALYMVALMALMNALSHGTQDLYPDFLAEVHHVASATIAWIVVAFTLGSVAGGFMFGWLSEPLGRRRAMLIALGLAIVVLPFWAFSNSLLVLAAAAVLLQVGVQGAWGIIPAHLNELAPGAVRGLLPGFAYQCGILIASGTPSLEFKLRDSVGYPRALAGFELAIIVALALMLFRGPERHSQEFG